MSFLVSPYDHVPPAGPARRLLALLDACAFPGLGLWFATQWDPTSRAYAALFSAVMLLWGLQRVWRALKRPEHYRFLAVRLLWLAFWCYLLVFALRFGMLWVGY